MSQQDVQIVRRFLDHAREAPETVWDIFAEDVEWVIGSLSLPDFPASCHGPDGVREFFRRWVSTFADWDYEVEEVLDRRDVVAVRIHQWGRGRESGVEVEQRFWQVWTLRDGKAVRVTHEFEAPA